MWCEPCVCVGVCAHYYMGVYIYIYIYIFKLFFGLITTKEYSPVQYVLNEMLGNSNFGIPQVLVHTQIFEVLHVEGFLKESLMTLTVQMHSSIH